MSKWLEHLEKWRECDLCPLSEGRFNIVLARGELPCDVMFIGEAPGASEDVLGRPFVGPAGKLLDDIIREASGGSPPRYCMTNLVACIPLGEDGSKTKEPPKVAIDACRDRLNEFIEIAEPQEIVYVGKMAYKHGDYEGVEITHPAAILRADESQKNLLIKRCEIVLENVFRRASQ